MKQIINKEDKAVSPIIATILLIAITVVLAATLYTVLGGFTKGLSSGNPTASASFTGSAANYSIDFTSVSGNVSMSSLTLQISNGSSPVLSVNLAGTYASGSYTTGVGTVPSSSTAFAYNITVDGANGGYLSSTTTITIKGYHKDNIVTSISIADKTTNSTLLSSMTPSPSIIVAQAVFRND